MTTHTPVPRIHGNHRCLASRLVGCALTNDRGEGVGTIEDLALDTRKRRIGYAVVSFGGFLGMGGKHFAMPWSRIVIGDVSSHQSVRATMDIARDDLVDAPGFDSGQWPDFADVRWAAKVEAHYRPGRTPLPMAPVLVDGSTDNGASPAIDGPATEVGATHHRLSQMIGMDVVDARHEALASIEDLVVNVQQGTIDGVVLSFGGVLGLGERFVLLPSDTLVYDADEDVFVVASHRERLEIMAVPPGTWPDIDSDEWWLGGRERLAMAKDVAERDAVGTAVATPDSVEASPMQERVEGVVVTIGSIRRIGLATPRLRLRVRADNGREIVVVGEAIDNSAQAALGLRNGDIVSVCGWRASHGPQALIVAQSITKGDRTMNIAHATPGERQGDTAG